MDCSTNHTSVATQQDAGVSNSRHEAQRGSSISVDRPTNRWDAPAFEEFDLCMEVTAYVYQWERF